MARRVHYKDGKLAIYDDTVPGAFTDPLNHLGSVYFHSDLSYLRIYYDETRTLNLPSRSSSWGYEDHNIFPAHNLGFMPWAILLVGNSQYPTSHPVQIVGNEGSGRYISLTVTATTVAIRSTYHTTAGHSVGATSLSCRAILLGPASGSDPGYAARFYPSGRLTLGEGKFDTGLNYLRRNDTTPDFWATSGRTIDTKTGGARFVKPNGETLNVQGYSGSFVGTQFFGIKD